MNLFNKLPDTVKFCIGLVSAVAAIAWIRELPKLNEQGITKEEVSQKNTVELMNIDIRVVDDTTSKSIENAEIMFVSKGTPEIRRTNTTGFTQIDIPPRKDIEITISKEGFIQAQYTLNPNNDPERTKTYRLKPQKKP